MRKVAINQAYGGFGLSQVAYEKYLDLKGIEYYKKNKNSPFGDIYYTVPEEEYNKLYEEAKQSGDWSNCQNKTLNDYHIDRDDPVLIRVIEEMGKDADSDYSALKIVEIPEDVSWHIEDYDGQEWVAEDHRVWS